MRHALGIAAVALTGLALTAPVAGGDTVASLREQVRNGTLSHTHGLTATCDLCLAQEVTTASGSAQVLSTDSPTGWGADDLAAALHLPAPDALGSRKGTVAVITGGAYPVLESDLAVYRAQYKLPECTAASGCLKIADLNGGPPLAEDPANARYDQAGAAEAALDVDMVSAACPECRVIVVQVPSTDAAPGPPEQLRKAMADFTQAVDTAIRLGANAVSMSIGFPNDSSAEAQAIGERLHHPGVAVVTASGDSGFQPTNTISWPADLPWVTVAGGVSITKQDSGFTQTAWRWSGSGCDTNQPGAFGAPDSVSDLCGGHRAAADVSAVSENVASYRTYAPYSHQAPKWTAAAGTSLAAPYVAGLYARGGHTDRVDGPNTVYHAPWGAFTNVTTGKNYDAANGQQACASDVQALCVAGPGWNGPTGVGTPNGLSGF
ncbi:MAG TPA: S8 family serine peptidase [Sporichthyaceae bacterium]|nr:S8 family serine peptidase [Sporichthyaceae bacterium]